MRVPTASIAALLLASACALTGASGCEKRPDSTAPPPGAGEPAASATAAPATAAAPRTRPFDPDQLVLFAPLPVKVERPDNLLTDDKVALGRMLWFDARLARGQDVSCNSCHDVGKSGADAVAISTGTKKQKGTRNAPTIFNAAGTFAQGWDSRAALVEDLVVPHAAEPSVMGSDGKRLIDTVSSIPAYAAAFKKAFPDAKGPSAVTGETIAMAIGAYSRKLLTPSRWDKFLAGDASAITDDEKAGLGAFIDATCTSCHTGKYVGGALNQKLGLAKAWPTTTDLGRFEVTKQDVDKSFFKVPTLRNVTRTAPYLHDGSVASLEEMTKLMSRHQVGKELTDAQAKSIVTFLGALEGDPPKDLVAKPDLPPAGAKTPKPE